MTSGDFLSTVSVVALLACVALLAVVSAIAPASQGRLGRRHAAVFSLCLMAIWVLADVVVALIRGAL